MKKFIIGAVAGVALLVCSAAQSNAQYPIARGVRGVARGAVRVAAPPYYAPRVVARPFYGPVYRGPVIAGPRYGYYGAYRPYYGGYGYGWTPGVSVGVGPVGVRVGF